MLPLNQMTMDVAGNRTRSFGMGDLTLQAKQLLIQRDGLQRTFRVAGKLAARLPAGNENANPPLGAGSYDAVAGLTAGWIQDRIGVYGDVSWAFFRSNFDDFRPGNMVDYNVAFGWRLLPAIYETFPMKQVNLYLEWINRPAVVIVDKEGVVRFIYYGTFWGDRPSIRDLLDIIDSENYDFVLPERLNRD